MQDTTKNSSARSRNGSHSSFGGVDWEFCLPSDWEPACTQVWIPFISNIFWIHLLFAKTIQRGSFSISTHLQSMYGGWCLQQCRLRIHEWHVVHRVTHQKCQKLSNLSKKKNRSETAFICRSTSQGPPLSIWTIWLKASYSRSQIFVSFREILFFKTRFSVFLQTTTGVFTMLVLGSRNCNWRNPTLCHFQSGFVVNLLCYKILFV